MASVRSVRSFSVNSAHRAACTSSGAPLVEMEVTASVQASAARSRGVGNGVSRHTGTA